MKSVLELLATDPTVHPDLRRVFARGLKHGELAAVNHVNMTLQSMSEERRQELRDEQKLVIDAEDAERRERNEERGL